MQMGNARAHVVSRWACFCLVAVACYCGQASADEPLGSFASAPPQYQGLWEGRSVVREKLLDDQVRKLTRSCEADFWFVVDPDGTVHGEGFIAYQIELQAIQWKIPVPNQGEIEAEVSGSAPKEIFRFGIKGTMIDRPSEEDPNNEEPGPLVLSLQATGQDEEGKAAPEENGNIPGISMTFSLDASVAIPTGVAGGAGAPLVPGGSQGIFSIPIPANGWSPFQGITPEVRIAPSEPSRVMAESRGEKHYILWYAVQQSLPPLPTEATPPS